jgi:hypothetical protein
VNGGGPGASAAPNGTLQPKTASIRARPTSSRITASEIEGIFAEKTSNGTQESRNKAATSNCPPSPVSSGPHKIYASVAEMKRSKVSTRSFLLHSVNRASQHWRNLALNT